MDPIANLEFVQLTNEQLVRHGIRSEKIEEGEASQLRADPIAKRGWMTHGWFRFDAHNVNPTTFKFTCSSQGQSHRLLQSRLVQRLPALRVVKKFEDTIRIAWPPHVGHHVIENASLVDGGAQRQSFNSVFLDYHAQYFLPPSEKYDRETGHIPQLYEWSTSLPEYVVHKSLPWFYSRSVNQGIPVDAPHENGNLEHVFIMRNAINKLLRMQKLDLKTHKWVDMVPDLRALVGVTGDTLEPPVLWGLFANSTTQEEQFFLKIPVTIEYHDAVFKEDTTLYKPGDAFSIPLEATQPTEAVFVGVTRVHPHLRYLGNYSNTIEGDWTRTGRCPLRRLAIKYAEYKRGQVDLPREIFEDATAESHFMFYPKEPGYCAIPFGMLVGEPRQSAVCLNRFPSTLMGQIDPHNGDLRYVSDEEMLRTIKSNEIELEDLVSGSDEVPVNRGESYRVFAICLVQRDVTYSYDAHRGSYVLSTSEPNDTPSAVHMVRSSAIAASPGAGALVASPVAAGAHRPLYHRAAVSPPPAGPSGLPSGPLAARLGSSG